MSVIAIITARGGSKRIPRKNIKDFCGKPILAYPIQAALDSGIFDHVMVSTDDEEIADIARKYGAEVPFMRSAETASDTATTFAVLREVVQKYDEMGVEIDYFACLYPCAPFITAKKLQDALALLKGSDATMLFTAVRYSHPPQRAYIMENGFVKFKYPEYANMRTQDLEPMYHDCGQFYFLDKKTFDIGDKAAASRRLPFIVPETEMQDIDDETDWKMAEIKYRMMIGE